MEVILVGQFPFKIILLLLYDAWEFVLLCNRQSHHTPENDVYRNPETQFAFS